MKLKTIIALSGCYGAGKSFLARSLATCEEMILPFATALREEIIEIGLAGRDEIYSKPTPGKIRTLLTSWGAYRRSQNKDYWVDLWLKKAQEITTDYPKEIIIVDDLRFMNELNALREFSNNNLMVLWIESEDSSKDDLSLFDLKLIKESADYIIKRGCSSIAN